MDILNITSIKNILTPFFPNIEPLVIQYLSNFLYLKLKNQIIIDHHKLSDYFANLLYSYTETTHKELQDKFISIENKLKENNLIPNINKFFSPKSSYDLCPIKFYHKFQQNMENNEIIDNLIDSIIFHKSTTFTHDKIMLLQTHPTNNLNNIIKKEKKEKKKNLDLHKNFVKVNDDIIEVWLESRKKSSHIIIDNYDMNTMDGSDSLLIRSSLKFVKGMKYGLVGVNGIGKTTLLRNISNYRIDGFPKNIRVLHVEQEIIGNDMSVLEYVLKSDAISNYILRKKSVEKDPEKIRILDSKLNELNFWEFEKKARNILDGLGFDEDKIKKKTKHLSGGWRMRVSIACALFISPDILLLDEPTNHLDFPSVIWLENYLKKYKNTVYIVSHDRHFLNNVIDFIIHFSDSTLNYYKGDYFTFEKVQINKEKMDRKAYEAQQAKIKHMQEFIDRFRYNAKKASMAQSRIKALKKMEMIDLRKNSTKIKLQFPSIDYKTFNQNENIVSLHNVHFGYNKSNLLFKGVNFSIGSESRIGLMGANGVGKTTLLKIMMDSLTPITGEIIRNRRARISHFNQHHVDGLDLEMSALDYVMDYFHDQLKDEKNLIEHCRAKLGKFGITQDLSIRQMKFLSGGQKSRVAFCMIAWECPHLIILDEPTNHLDMETIDALIESINNFNGGILVVSHDQHFVSSIAKDFWAIHSYKIKEFSSFANIKKFVSQKVL